MSSHIHLSNFDVRTTWASALAELFLKRVKIYIIILDEVLYNLEQNHLNNT